MYHAVWDIQYNSGLSAEGGCKACPFSTGKQEKCKKCNFIFAYKLRCPKLSIRFISIINILLFQNNWLAFQFYPM